jgi:uncharacterized LabA/DUF88 family protein
MEPQGQTIYAFIDSQNLNLGIKSQGWDLDFGKFRLYLTNKYHVSKAFLFIGYLEKNQRLYTILIKHGYQLVFKPTFTGPNNSVKGNVDAELVLHTMIELPNFDKAVIVSGDGDFHCLVEYLVNRNKLLHLMTPNAQYSSLYKQYSGYIVQLSRLKGSLQK